MQTCKNCIYFFPSHKGKGICKRYPPRWYFPGQGWAQPEVNETDECGEWSRLNKNPWEQI